MKTIVISRTWDDRELPASEHVTVRLSFEAERVRIWVDAPFHDDPAPRSAEPPRDEHSSRVDAPFHDDPAPRSAETPRDEHSSTVDGASCDESTPPNEFAPRHADERTLRIERAQRHIDICENGICENCISRFEGLMQAPRGSTKCRLPEAGHVSLDACATGECPPSNDPVRHENERPSSNDPARHENECRPSNDPALRHAERVSADPEGAHDGWVSGQCVPRLWEHEVVELFFLGSHDHYLEVELAPRGHYLVLMLEGRRNIVEQGIAIDYRARIDAARWRGEATFPTSLLPPGFDRLNATAIWGQGAARTYAMWRPCLGSEPDFHALSVFAPFDAE